MVMNLNFFFLKNVLDCTSLLQIFEVRFWHLFCNRDLCRGGSCQLSKGLVQEKILPLVTMAAAFIQVFSLRGAGRTHSLPHFVQNHFCSSMKCAVELQLNNYVNRKCTPPDNYVNRKYTPPDSYVNRKYTPPDDYVEQEVCATSWACSCASAQGPERINIGFVRN